MDVHDLGGFVLVQTEETAKFDGMPRSAIDTGLADVRLARAYDVLLHRYVPTGVLVNDRRELLHLFGEAGREAINRFTETPDIFCLVILDLTMPVMDGAATFTELRKIRPEIKVLLISGYNEKEAASRFAGRKLAGFLQKPFSTLVFQQAVRAILEEPAN
jgi:CheY-like chemotaxis protein